MMYIYVLMYLQIDDRKQCIILNLVWYVTSDLYVTKPTSTKELKFFKYKRFYHEIQNEASLYRIRCHLTSVDLNQIISKSNMHCTRLL